jgi:hypothetical protein
MKTYEPIKIESRVGAMVWKRAGMSVNTWRLVCRGHTFATFTFMNAAQTVGVLRTETGAWEISETFGGIAPHIAIRGLESDREIAAFRPASTGHGRVDFAGGPVFRWRRAASASRPTSIVTLKGGPIATVGQSMGPNSGLIPIFLADDALNVVELPVLLGVALYNSVRTERGTLHAEDADCLEDTIALVG